MAIFFHIYQLLLHTSNQGAQYDNKGGRDYHIPTRGSAAKKPPLHVVHVAVEMAPIAKVGGLGDVVEGLARAHGKMGHAVTVILPFYSCLPTDKIDGLTHVMDYDVTKGRYQDGETRYFNFARRRCEGE